MAFDFILCADDYGMAPGVSRGILEAAAAGRISAASAMTSLPDWPRAARDWVAVAPPADLGLHLNLTVGCPLGAMPGVAPAGVFPALGMLLRARQLPGAEIAAEIHRQIDAFTAAMGRAPTHVDGHQHVHVLPSVRQALFAALRRAEMEGVRLRDSSDEIARILRRRGSLTKAISVAMFARGFADEARADGHVVNDGFAGFSSFDPRADLSRQFARFLTAPGERHLVMCHPGHVDAELAALDPVTTARKAELVFLLSDRWPALQAQHGARLVCAFPDRVDSRDR